MDGVTVDNTAAVSGDGGYGAYRPYPPPPPPPTPPPDPRRRRIMIAVLVGWVLVLVGGGVWTSFRGRPTVREQTTISQAEPVVDRAVGDLLGAAGTGPVSAITGYTSTGSCAVTPVRPGVRYQREVRFFVAPGGEPALLKRIATGLPGRYAATVSPPVEGSGRRLRADAGDYVGLSGVVSQPGLVTIVASTGCRPLGGQPTTDPTEAPAAADRAPIEAVLNTLGSTAARWSTHVLACGVRTVQATSPAGTQPGPLNDALRSTGGTPVVSTTTLYADRAGLAVRVDGTSVLVTRTTGHC